MRAPVEGWESNWGQKCLPSRGQSPSNGPSDLKGTANP